MLKLYKFQQEAIDELIEGKRLAILPTGAGKTAVMFNWLKETGKKRVLVVTTPSKVKSGDMITEAVMWCGQEWVDSLEMFEVVSWYKLKKWCKENNSKLDRWLAVAFDEVAKAKGYSSGMGVAFRRIADSVIKWSGYTATPGDKWIDLMPYMVAAGEFRNKTEFINRHAIVQNYKGYPEIQRYLDTEHLQDIWDSITTRPDTSQLMKELPSETHKIVEFKAPSGYKKFLKERIDPDTGEYVETAMGVVHKCRQMCFTKEKQEWLSEFIEGLGANCIFFCNYIEEEEKLAEIAKKVLPKGARIWRIDGSHHEIPTAGTIGKYDVVIAHYLSGGEALNLQFMHYWVSVSPNYSLTTSVQARGRIKRIGQKSPMFFYYTYCCATIEEDIMKCLKSKKDFSERVWCAKNIEGESS